MKILLTSLNAKYVHSSLALRYLGTAARNAGFSAACREFTINNEKDYIYGELVRGEYDIIGFSCYIWNIERIREVAANVKKACPQIRILLGGPEVSCGAGEFLRENPWADWILRGEGEASLVQLLRSLCGTGELSDVAGLTYRDGSMIRENDDGQPLTAEQIPFPYSVFPVEEDKVVYYEASRGCPYRCSYCLSSLEKRVRPLPLERVEKELSYFLNEQVRQVKFIDRTFNYDVSRAQTIWKFLMDHDNGKTNFHFEICADLLDKASLQLLSHARKGLFQLEIGIQSTDKAALAAVERKAETDRLFSNVRALTALKNIHIHTDLIAGLPFEDYETFGRSFDQVYALQSDNLQLGFLKLLKGTKLREQEEKYGYIYRENAPYEVISNRYISAGELVQLKMIENVLELYGNRGGFSKSLEYLIRRTGKSPFAFYERLAAFFYDSGFQHRSHRKEDLYRILLRFAGSMEGEFAGIEDETRQLLENDLEETMNFDAVKKFHRKGWEI